MADECACDNAVVDGMDLDVTTVHLQDRADALFDHGFDTLEDVGSGEEAEE